MGATHSHSHSHHSQNASPGDVSIEIGGNERSQADAFAHKRGDAFAQSKACYAKGDHAGAKKHSIEGKHFDAEVHAWNKKAAQVIFEGHNHSREINEIDLHGLFVSEAIAAVEERIKLCKAKKIKELTVITGKGLHSANGVCKIRPAIMELVHKHSLRCTEDPHNAGVLKVEFVKPSEAGFFSRWMDRNCVIM